MRLDRFFGPHLGVRVSTASTEADATPETLIHFAGIAGTLILGSGIVSTTSTLGTVLFADDIRGFRPGVLFPLGITGILLGLVIRRLRGWPKLWMVHALSLGAILLISCFALSSGPVLAPYAAICYVLNTVGMFAFLTRRGALTNVAFVALNYAVVLHVLEPVPTPIGQWFIIASLAVVGGFAVEVLVTKLAELAAAEVAAREALEVASQHKSDFLAGMSHELRTPLNAVIGFADVLEGQHFGPLNERQREYVEDIQVAGRHLLALINDVLDLSKVEAGRMEICPTWFSLGDTIASSVQLVRPRADQQALRIVVDGSPEAEQAYGDQLRIQQVLVNLLSNAVKFTPTGGSITVVARGDEGGVTVSVRDTGIGIAEADLERVFEDFQQAGGAGGTREGTGLGLPLSRRFLELHGGELWVESTPGAGSAFTFRLPSPARDRVATS
ncbi:MAG: ATP-binding protein [Actinomycetota bacterium]|nr:ATP-binding protein [Actinomycetota bacterium]